MSVIFSIYVDFYLTKVKVKSLVNAMEACIESRGRAPLILNLGNIWISVASFALQPLYHQREGLVPNEAECRWSPESVWRLRRDIVSLLPGNEPRIVHPEAK
jgi:hypothetical protein